MRAIFVVAIAGWLAGCAQTAGFVAGDASRAAAIDPSAAACWNALGASAEAAGGATGSFGVLSAIATKMAVQQALAAPACAPVSQAIVIDLLDKGGL